MKFKTLLRYLKPRYYMNAKKGNCTICGRRTFFILTEAPELIRNHAICIWCGSCSRNRHIAKLVLEEFGSVGIKRLSDFGSHPELVVFNNSSAGPIAKALGRFPNITCSEYFEDIKPGEYKNGIMNQDLKRLTFTNESINLIISEDVFEHIPEYLDGLKEVYRVLKKGGTHIFSIPFFFDKKTEELFNLVEGRVVLREPIEFHGDPIRGQIPCYTYIGYDAITSWDEMGFDVKIAISRYAESRTYGTFDCYTFITKKR